MAALHVNANKEGVAAFRRGDFEDSIEHFSISLELCDSDGSRMSALNNRASAFAGLSRFEEALVDIDKVLEIDASNKAIFKKANYLVELNRHDDALALFSHAIESFWSSDSVEYVAPDRIVDLLLDAKFYDTVKNVEDAWWQALEGQYAAVFSKTGIDPQYRLMLEEDRFKYLKFRSEYPIDKYRARNAEVTNHDGSEKAKVFRNHVQSHIDLSRKAYSDFCKSISQINARVSFSADESFCSHCGREQPHLLKCAGCKLTRYCSRECQKAAWPQHKNLCKEASLADAKKAKQNQREPMLERNVSTSLLKCPPLPPACASAQSWEDLWLALKLKKKQLSSQAFLKDLSACLTYPMTILHALAAFGIDYASRPCLVHMVGRHDRYEGLPICDKSLELLKQHFPKVRVERILSPAGGPAFYEDVMRVQAKFERPGLIILCNPGLQHTTLWNWQTVVAQIMRECIPLCIACDSAVEYTGLKESIYGEDVVGARFCPLRPHIVADRRNPFSSMLVSTEVDVQEVTSVPDVYAKTVNMFFILIKASCKEDFELHMMLDMDVFGTMKPRGGYPQGLHEQICSWEAQAKQALESGDTEQMAAALSVQKRVMDAVIAASKAGELKMA